METYLRRANGLPEREILARKKKAEAGKMEFSENQESETYLDF
jgi:hypothetical protein